MRDRSNGSTPASRGRLVSLVLTRFRGFNDTVELDFDASAVLLHGPNGIGKTSVFDAVQWLLTGEIPRLMAYRLRRNDEFLLNAFGGSKPASVEARIKLGEREIRVTRRGDGGASRLELEDETGRHDGLQAEAVLARLLSPGTLPLSEALHTSGLLQQDDLRQLLQTKPDARYRQLMRLLGLEAIEGFEQSVLARKTQAREAVRAALHNLESTQRALTAATESLDTALAQVERSSTGLGHASLVQQLLAQHLEQLQFVADQEDAEALWNLRLAANDLEVQSELAIQLLSALPDDLPDVGEEQLQQAADAVEAAEESRVRAAEYLARSTQARVAAAVASDAVEKLAAAALPVLHEELETEPCPVCGTRISPRKVSSELRAKAAGASALAELDAVLRSAESANTAALARVSESRALNNELQAQWNRRLSVLKNASDLRQNLQAIEQRTTLRPARALAIPTLGEPVGPAEYYLLLRWRARGIELLRDVVEGCRSLKASVADVAKQEAASRAAAERAASIPRLRERVAKTTSMVVAARAAHEEARRASTNAASMAEATTAASGEIGSSNLTGHLADRS